MPSARSMSRTAACAAAKRRLIPCRLQLLVQRRQHARPRKVDDGRGGQVADHELQRLGGRADLLPDRVARVLGVEVEQRRLDAEHERARNGLVVRVALDVREDSECRECGRGRRRAGARRAG